MIDGLSPPRISLHLHDPIQIARARPHPFHRAFAGGRVTFNPAEFALIPHISATEDRTVHPELQRSVSKRYAGIR